MTYAHFGTPGKVLDLAPVLAAVLRDLQQAVVGADVEQPFDAAAIRRSTRCCESGVVDSCSAIESGGHTLPMIGISASVRLRVRSGLMRVHVVAAIVGAIEVLAAPSRAACASAG